MKISKKTKLAKTLATLALVGALTVTPLSLTACAINTDADNTTPGVSDTQTPGGSTPTDTTQPNTENTERYSQILQNIINSDYYNNLIDEYMNKRWYSNNKTSGLPFRFLESQGFDVTAMKNDQIKCTSTAYVMNEDTNTLYLSVKVTVPNGNADYYSCYKLKYSLTDAEYNDLYMLHEHNYIQAPFFIQELSETKTPTVMSNLKIDAQTYDKLEDVFNSIQDFKDLLNGTIKIDFIKITDAKHITIECRSNPSSSKMLTENCICRTMDLLVYNQSLPTITNSIYKIKTINDTALTSTNVDDFVSNYSTITYFYTDNVNHVNILLTA